jgi:hypothetical protein
MKRTIFIMLLIVSGAFLLGAQTATEPAQPETSYDYEPIRKGDQLITGGLGITIPLFNMTPDGLNKETNINTGGTGNIGYSRFITSNIALGGEITFAFNTTLGENLLFYLPLTFRATYALVFDRIHVPLSLGVGGAIQTYNDINYFGLIVKPEIGAFYQYSPEWSFGGTVDWNIMPEWYKNSADDRTANMLAVGFGFRYHF